jgi:hypothetical protein
MDTLLFSARSIWTMVHGILLGGGALLGIAAALYTLVTVRIAGDREAAAEAQGRHLGWLLGGVAVALWLTVLVGTYINFPPYRATAPEGVTNLTAYPRALLHSAPATVWLHSFAMETKEHMPWIAAMLATAVAFVALRKPSHLLTDPPLRRMATTLLAICFAIVAFVSLLGVFINKVAPLE